MENKVKKWIPWGKKILIAISPKKNQAQKNPSNQGQYEKNKFQKNRNTGRRKKNR